jgi:DNA-binding MarR family transcriptional regulator
MKTLDSPVQVGPTAARLRLVLARLVRTLRRDSPSRLSASQISALATIEDFGPMRISTLAAHESMDPSVATRVVASLETQGYFERKSDPNDKRACLVELSVQGHEVLSTLWNERTLKLSSRLEQLSAKDRRTIENALPVLEKLARDF